MRQTPLHAIIRSDASFGRADDAPPVELVRTLLDRGANPDLVSNRGTVLQEAVEAIRSNRSRTIAPVAKVLLEYGADVFAVHKHWDRQPVFELQDSLIEKGHTKLAGRIPNEAEEGRRILEDAVHAGVKELLARLRNADEKALLTLNAGLPYAQQQDWLTLGRSLQKTFGPSLKDSGDVERLVLRGRWAEVRLSTKRGRERGQLHILLMKYPGDAYHAVAAGPTDDEHPGRYIRHAMMGYSEFKNAVYSAFEWSHMYGMVGEGNREYSSRIRSVSIRAELDRLIVRRHNGPSWLRLHVELTPDVIWRWDDT